MTDERANEIAEIFVKNHELAKRKGATEPMVALAAAIVYTIDDLLHSDPKTPVSDLNAKLKSSRK